MAHWSEGAKRLKINEIKVDDLGQLESIDSDDPNVWLFRLPLMRTAVDSHESISEFRKLAQFAKRLSDDCTVCIITSPADAAILLPYLEDHLKFQLWVALRTNPVSFVSNHQKLAENHVALLVLTKYKKSLRHTKTRIQYTYCPACNKTTKDYGGKKHTYHEYGTLLSDVWRDIEYEPNGELAEVGNRIADLFGLEPNRFLHVVDLRELPMLRPKQIEQPVAILPITSNRQSNQILLESQLINGDCLIALSDIPDDSVDFCFADPPYNLEKKYDRSDDGLEISEYFTWCDKWLSELYRVLKPGHTLAVLNIPLWSARHFQFLSLFANFQSWIAWDGLSFPVRQIMPAHYGIVCVTKGESRQLPLSEPSCKGSVVAMDERYCIRSGCISRRNRFGDVDRMPITNIWSDIHRLKHNSRRVDHPCQLPPLLMERLFKTFTHSGELILDCFNGAGTSTLVAQQIGRRFIGIELSEKYHEIAEKRHGELLGGIDPFGKTSDTPKAKNSRVQRMQKQKYAVSKKTLQLDVRRIANKLGRLPTKDEVREISSFPFEYFENYFASWGEVCAAARTTGMSETPESPLDEIQFSLFAEN